jgi:hypothetical protein
VDPTADAVESQRRLTEAIATMVAINSAYAIVMRHNYKVARNQR